MTNLLLMLSIIGCMAMSHSCKDSSHGQFEGPSALHQAAAKNRQDVMTTLLQKGTDINARASNGSTVLHLAAARGDLSAVQFILGKGINTELANNDGLTALHLAAVNNHQNVMGALLANGADVNARAADGSTLLHLAVANDMMGSVEFILKSENVLMSPKNNDLFTPLVLAERLGHVEVAALLRDRIGNISVSSLVNAAYNGTLDDARSLVFRGADVNGYGEIHGNFWTPLHEAAHVNFDIVKFLVEHGAEVNMKASSCGQPPLYEAAYWGKLDTVKYLVENGAEINPLGCGHTPMFVANQNKHPDVVAYLKSVGGEM